ncbi:MAG: F0F1 ATP synthase subunit alpha, partial [Pseudomonadota bacterium]
IRPAINAGLSVSRVGGAAQTKIIKKLGGGVRLDLAQYRELAAFAQFASDLDEATRNQIERGQRVTELMKQNQFSPMSVAQLAVSLFSANGGFLDDIAPNKVTDFEAALQDYMVANEKALMDQINESGNYDSKIENSLKSAIENFKSTSTW